MLLGAIILLCAVVWFEALHAGAPHELTFAVLDIGQGDALFIESPTGTQVLLDSGPDSAVLAQLPKVMPAFDRTLDAVIESHPDADHMGGFVDVLRHYRAGAFIEPGIEKHNATVDALEGEVGDEHIPRYIARRGMLLDLGGGAYLQVLSPDTDVTHMPASIDNEGGIVARLIYGDTSAILMADVSKKVEDHLLALDGRSLQSDILKVGHHGSRFSSDPQFIAAVHPSMAAISVGAGNSYGHPTEETLDTLRAQHIEVSRTDEDGLLVFKSDGSVFRRVR